MKNPTNFRKTVETGVDSCMSLLKPWITLELNFIMISFFAIEINITWQWYRNCFTVLEEEFQNILEFMRN